MKKTIAILTNFQEFNPGYSLCCIVIDQAHMLARFGHKVYIYVNEVYNPKHDEDSGLEALRQRYSKQIFLRKKTIFMDLKDYTTKTTISAEHKKKAKLAAEEYLDDFRLNKIEAVFTHDFVFTGWNLPYLMAIDILQQSLSKEIKFFHWIHSVPTVKRDWWKLEELSQNNFLVYPNYTDRILVAESYRTTENRVHIIPHIKDIRTWFDFGVDTMSFIDRYPKLMQAELIQVYPCSSDRLAAKRLHLVIKLFGIFKKAQVNVFLIIANQWATGRQNRESIDKYIELAEALGLVYGEDFVFTSEHLKTDIHESLAKSIYKSKTIEALLAEFKVKSLDEFKSIGLAEFLEFDFATINKDNFIEKKAQLVSNMRKYPTGIDRKLLRELQLLSNMFIFPTREESFGLVGPEAAFSGVLAATNKSLSMMAEVMGFNTSNYHFGSYNQNHPEAENDNYLVAVAHSILQKFFADEAIGTKNYCRLRYNFEAIYNRYYLPIL